ncbi:hypothetical protein ACN38_g3537 [Penicillium nordicum]|uniref:Uncharacterized protein n=1 Tax=Penicillium nordicum TaxID=229535 RepID=A0A0M8P4Z2_9EURO|nr:hypothetical protein ACN38_g3537 [Penicillium nordicum]
MEVVLTQRCVRSPQKPRLHYSPNPLIVWVQKVEIPLSHTLCLSHTHSLSHSLSLSSVICFFSFSLGIHTTLIPLNILYIHYNPDISISVSNVLSAFTPALAYLSASLLAAFPRVWSTHPWDSLRLTSLLLPFSSPLSLTVFI